MDEDVIIPITEWPVDDGLSYSNVLPHSDTRLKQKQLKRHHRGPKDSDNVCKLKKRLEIDMADVALARWWRQKGRLLIPPSSLPNSTNPHTVLNCVQRTKAGKDFLQNKLKKLISMTMRETDLVPNDACSLFTAISSFHDKLGEFHLAKKSIEKALISDPEEPTALWLNAKLEREMRIQSLQMQFLADLQKSNLPLLYPEATSVERRSFNDLSLTDFLHYYSMKNRPVIITDFSPFLSSERWTLQYLKEKAGHLNTTLKKYVEGSVEWARLEEGKTTTVAEFIQNLQNDTAEEFYLFDWSLPLHAPALVNELTIPKYFAGDLLQRTVEGSLYKNSWPSLFIAPKGLITPLHVDAFGSNFWMALFEGSKRWTFFPKEDRAKLYPSYHQSMDPVFEADINIPDLTRQPLLSLTHPMECTLKPGEMLFVPAGCPHRVENLEVSVAISGNFVDVSNFSMVKEELKINGLTDPRAKDLFDQFDSENFNIHMDKIISNLSWQDFKKYPR